MAISALRAGDTDVVVVRLVAFDTTTHDIYAALLAG